MRPTVPATCGARAGLAPGFRMSGLQAEHDGAEVFEERARGYPVTYASASRMPSRSRPDSARPSTSPRLLTQT